MTRACLVARVRRLIELRAVCELAPTGRPTQRARLRYEQSVRLLVFLTQLPGAQIERIAESFFVGWLRKGRTTAIRRAKARAADRASSEALRAMQAAVEPMPGREVA